MKGNCYFSGATGVKQARYRRGPSYTRHGAARHSTRMRSIIHSLFVEGTCCSMHGVMLNSAEGFALVLSLSSVCLSVFTTVPAQRPLKPANNGTHGFLLGFSWINMCGVSFRSKVMAWKSQYANEFELTVSRFHAVSGPTNRSSYVKSNWWVECCFYWCNRRETSERRPTRARHSHAHAQYTHIASACETCI